MSVEKWIKKAAEILKEAQYAVVLTGAGISTESGIPDFRSPGTGLWEKEDPEDFTIQRFFADPAGFYRRIKPLLDKIKEARPNTGHVALSRMEEMGVIKTVITQNVDSLHQAAGSKRVLEVHGTFATGSCIDCRQQAVLDDLLFLLEEGADPACAACGGAIKPDVTLFGESMPADFKTAHQEVLRSDCLLVVGSSLQVAPVAFLPRYSNNLMIINRGTTPFDDAARLVFRTPAGETLSAILDELQK